MNPHKVACQRDSDIIRDIGRHRILDIIQLQMLHFPSIYTAQRRMLALTRAKKVHRLRLMDSSFAYYLDTKPQQVEHFLGIADFKPVISNTLE